MVPGWWQEGCWLSFQYVVAPKVCFVALVFLTFVILSGRAGLFAMHGPTGDGAALAADRN